MKVSECVSLVLCIFSVVINGLEVDDCGNGVPKPSYVEVVGCDKQPCPLIQGKDVIVYMNFTAYEPVQQLKAGVTATVGINIDFPLPRPDACQELTDTNCPLELNELAQYKLVMPIEEWYPTISLKLTFYLLHNGNTNKDKKFICFALNAKVTK